MSFQIALEVLALEKVIQRGEGTMIFRTTTLVLVGLFIFTLDAEAQPNLPQEVREVVAEFVINDSWPEYRTFSRMTLAQAVEGSVIAASIPTNRQQELDRQLPNSVQSMVSDTFVQVLYIESCLGQGIYGIPRNADPDIDAQLYQFLSLVRLTLALRDAGIEDNISAGFLLGILYDTNSMARVNFVLMQLYEAGALNVPHLILDDFVDGCGAGEIEVSVDLESSVNELHIIPEVYFLACEQRLPDPFDTQACREWESVHALMFISGIWIWQGIDDDGTFVTSRLNVDRLGDRPTISLN